MLSRPRRLSSVESQDSSVKRSPPHCRTCGKPMKGHKMALCQLRSPSEEVGRSQSSLSPTPRGVQGSKSLVGQPRYPYDPISPEPSWELPSDGGFLHRRNPHIPSPFGIIEEHEHTPLIRTDSWESTEKAESDCGGEDAGSTLTAGRIFLTSSTSSESRHSSPFSSVRSGSCPPTPPYTPPDSPSTELEHGAIPAVDVLDTAGNKILGLDMSMLGDQLGAVLRQANKMGLHATLVRPHIGYQHNSVHIRTNEDANQHTTVFVSPARHVGGGGDEIAINMMCNNGIRDRLAGVNEVPTTTSLRSRMQEVDVKFWILVFSAMFAASLFSGWVNNQLFL